MLGLKSPRALGSSFKRGANTIVSFWLDENGNVSAFSPNAKTFFSVTTMMGKPFKNLYVADGSTKELGRFPPEGDLVEGAVFYRGREGRRDKGEIQVIRLRDKRKETTGYTVNAHFQDAEYDGFEGLPEGYLLKKASLSANKWQRRYFRARKVVWPDKPAEYVLDYFSDNTSLVAKGSIKLQGSAITTNFRNHVFTICRTGLNARDVFLKAPNPLIRWQWARALHSLSLYGQDLTEEMRKEMEKAQRIQGEFQGHTNLDSSKKEGATWREKAGRHGGSDGFQISDLARIAMRRMQSNSHGLSAKIPTNVFDRDINFNSKYLSVQILAARSLNVGSSSKVVVKLSLVGPGRLRDEVGETEIGYGPDPVFDNGAPDLCKARKLHNILAHVHLPEQTNIKECLLLAKAYELGAFGEKVLGESRLSLQKLPSGKLASAWHRLKPLDKRRGELKMTFYYEPERKKPKHRKQNSSFSDDEEEDGKDDGFDDFEDDPFKTEEKGWDVEFPDDSKTEELKIAQQEITALKASLEAARASAAAAAAAAAAPSPLAKELETERIARAEIEQALKGLETEKAKSDETLKTLEEEKKKLQEESEKMQAYARKAVQDKKKVDAELKRRLTGAKKLYDRELAGRKKAEASLAKLRKQLTEAGAKTEAAAKTALEALKEEIRDLEAQLAKANSERDAAEKSMSKLEKSKSDADETTEKLRSDLKESLANVDKLNGELDASKAKIKELSEENKTLKAEIVHLKQQLASLEREMGDKMKELESQIAVLRAEKGEAEAETGRAEAAFLKLEAELKRVKAAEAAALKRAEEAEAEAISAMTRAQEAESSLEAAAAAAEEAERARKAEAEAAALAAKANAKIPRHLRVQLAMYARYFNAVLGDITELSARGVIPLSEEESQWAGRRGVVSRLSGDGLLIATYLNFCVPGAIDSRAMHVPGKGGPLSKEQELENLSLVARTCKSVGVAVGRTSELVELLSDPISRPGDAAEFLFSLVSFHVLNEVRLERCPELKEAIDEESKLERMAAFPAELIGAWIPHHVSSYRDKAHAAQSLPSTGAPDQKAMDLSSSWGDLRVPAFLVAAVTDRAGPLVTVRAGSKSIELARDMIQPEAIGERHQRVVEQLEHLGAKHAASFLVTSGIGDVNGEEKSGEVSVTWRRANLLFAACLLDASSELMMSNSPDFHQESESTEVAATKVWLNNLGLKDVPRVHDLFAASKDGLLLLKILEKMSPGCVNWRKAELKPNHKIKRISNCSLAVEIAKKSPFSFSLVGVGGPDIYGGNKKLTMSLLWQMRRFQLLEFLKVVFQKRTGGNDKAIARKKSISLSSFDESILINWANGAVQDCLKRQGLPDGSQRLFSAEKKNSKDNKSIQSLKDETLSTSIFYLLLLWSKSPFSVNWRFVTPGTNDEQKVLNARYAITVARKIGVSVFVLPEDLVEINQKMVLVFLGGILGLESSAEDQD